MLQNCKIRNSDGETIFQIEIADTFMKRFLGLMGRKKIPCGRGPVQQYSYVFYAFFNRRGLY